MPCMYPSAVSSRLPAAACSPPAHNALPPAKTPSTPTEDASEDEVLRAIQNGVNPFERTGARGMSLFLQATQCNWPSVVSAALRTPHAHAPRVDAQLRRGLIGACLLGHNGAALPLLGNHVPFNSEFRTLTPLTAAFYGADPVLLARLIQAWLTGPKDPDVATRALTHLMYNLNDMPVSATSWATVAVRALLMAGADFCEAFLIVVDSQDTARLQRAIAMLASDAGLRATALPAIEQALECVEQHITNSVLRTCHQPRRSLPKPRRHLAVMRAQVLGAGPIDSATAALIVILSTDNLDVHNAKTTRLVQQLLGREIQMANVVLRLAHAQCRTRVAALHLLHMLPLSEWQWASLKFAEAMVRRAYSQKQMLGHSLLGFFSALRYPAYITLAWSSGYYTQGADAQRSLRLLAAFCAGYDVAVLTQDWGEELQLENYSVEQQQRDRGKFIADSLRQFPLLSATDVEKCVFEEIKKARRIAVAWFDDFESCVVHSMTALSARHLGQCQQRLSKPAHGHSKAAIPKAPP